MNREVADKWCERGILGLVLAILIFGPLATGAVRTLEFLVLQAMTIAVMLLWAARLWVSPRPQLLWPPVSWAVLLFAAYAIARYLTADLEYVARLEMVRVLVYAFLFLAMVNNLHRQEHIRLMVFTLVFLGMAISAYAIYQFATGSQKVWHFTTPYPKRGTGTFISPNNLAGFLGMVLPLGLAWTLVSRARHVTRIFLAYASLVILAGIVVSVSRAGWFSAGVVLLVFFGLLIAHRTYRIPAIVLLVLAIGAAIYFVPRADFFQKRMEQLSHTDQQMGGRLDMWKPALTLWRENFWFGIGPNHYDYRFREYRPPTQQLQPDRVHNDYLNTLTDWGIVGALLVVATLVLLWVGAFKTGKAVQRKSTLGEGQSNKFAIVLGASLGLLAILLHSFTDFNLHIPSNAIVAVTLMAMLSSALRFATDDYWTRVRLASKLAVTALLVAGVTCLGWQGVRRYQEYVWLAKVDRIRKLKPVPAGELTRALEKAFAAEPRNFQTAYEIGEAYRIQSWGGAAGYEDLAKQAMGWFERSLELNPYNGYGYLGYGMCLDWLDRTVEAEPYFQRAAALDPNGYFTAANVGWHYVQVGNYPAAREWLERSLRMKWEGNQIADTYLPLVTGRMLERATNSNSGLILPVRR